MRTGSVGLRGLALRRRPDVELVDAAISGDPVAFSEVYRRYHAPLYAFCLSRLMKPSLAEDASQEVFMRLLSARAGTFDKPLSWLYGVARNVCVDVSRRDGREFPTDLTTLSLPDPFDTADHVTAREDGERIAIALRGINPRYRTALTMHEMHALSAPEIAKAFGIGLGATYTLLSRSRDAFNASYEKAEGLSAGCKHALCLLYRREAGNVSDLESARLDQHLEECAPCAKEARRVARTRQWTTIRAALTMPALSQSWAQLASRFGPATVHFAPQTSHSIGITWAAAVTAVTVGAAAVLVPGLSTDPPALTGAEIGAHVVAAHGQNRATLARAIHRSGSDVTSAGGASATGEYQPRTRTRMRDEQASGVSEPPQRTREQASVSTKNGSPGGSVASPDRKSGAGSSSKVAPPRPATTGGDSGSGGGGEQKPADTPGAGSPESGGQPAGENGSGNGAAPQQKSGSGK